MFVPRRCAAAATKTLLYAASIVAASMSISQPVLAVTITDVTDNVTLFSDNFENQAVGSAPTEGGMSSSPVGASWTTTRSGTGTSRNVIDALAGTSLPPDAPGPYQGSNYLLLDIPRNVSGATAQATAWFTPLPAGNTLSISFAYAWGTGGTTITVLGEDFTGNGSGGPQLELFDADDNKVIWMDSGDANFHFYDSDANEVGTIAGAKGALGIWHTFNLTYTQGTSDLTVTVDGNSTTLLGAVADSTLLPDHLRMYTTRAGVIAYDAIPSTLPGDFNGDGFVDAADYVTWRKGLDTEFDEDDYKLWRAHFGEPSEGGGSSLGDISVAGTANVPEPGSFLLAALGGLTLGIARNGRSRRSRKRA